MVFGSKPGLERMEHLLRVMGNPERSLRVIHVAGTNGKGSVAAMTASVLQEAGYSVGLYTSPHLSDYFERFLLNGRPMAKERFAELVSDMKAIAERINEETGDHPTVFETLTAMMYRYFAEEGIDWLVQETGLGGRLDATNLTEAELAVITTIGHDHLEILGSSLEDVAFEKAGIIKKNALVVTGIKEDSLLKVIKQRVSEENAKLITVKGIEYLGSDLSGTSFSVDGYTFKTSLIGEHQAHNGALVYGIVKALEEKGVVVPLESFAIGLLNTKWPGRLEVIQKRPLVVLDGAHNPEGVIALKSSLCIFPRKRLIMVVGILKDKQREEMLKEMLPLADLVIYTKPSSMRASLAEEVLEISKEISSVPCLAVSEPSLALEQAIAKADEEDMVLVWGSLYLIGELRSVWFEQEFTIS